MAREWKWEGRGTLMGFFTLELLCDKRVLVALSGLKDTGQDGFLLGLKWTQTAAGQLKSRVFYTLQNKKKKEQEKKKKKLVHLLFSLLHSAMYIHMSPFHTKMPLYSLVVNPPIP